MNDGLRARLLTVEAGLERPSVRPIDPARLAARARARGVRRGLLATAAVALCAWIWPSAPDGRPTRSGVDELDELRLHARAAVAAAAAAIERSAAERDARIRALESAGVRSFVATSRLEARARARDQIRRRIETR